MHTTHQQLLYKFYDCFVRGDAEGMIAFYADDIEFEDPAFGPLKGNDAKNMWRMLLAKSKGQLKIVYGEVWADEQTGSASWTATYPFSKTGRKVVNSIEARFVFENGRIKKHTEFFDLWKWAKQALGIPGLLLGWSGYMKNKIRSNALAQLASFSTKHS